MKRTRLLTLIAVALFGRLALAEVNALSEAERRGGWKLLFDGKSTKGWRNYRQSKISSGWQVRDGAMTRVAAGAGDLVTTKKYKYFELSMEYKIARGGNSGLMFHVTEELEQPGMSGPEVQILDNKDGKDPQKAGWLYQLYKPVKPSWAKRVEQQAGFKVPDVDDATRSAGQWNHIYLRVSPKQSEVAINGVSYYYFVKGDAEWKKRVAKSKFVQWKSFGKADSGLISLQDHGDPVAFRNVKIRVLPESGKVPDPSDGDLALEGKVAFPGLKFEGWEGQDEQGRIRPLRPMILTHAGDGSGRIFVGTQRGAVHVFSKRAPKRTRIMLDISKRVADWKKGNEEGLLGMALHPQFKKSGQLYVYYSSAAKVRTSIVSRFRLTKDGSKFDPASEEILMELPQPFSNHNGGAIAFGKDGYLYIALGDGGHRNDPLGNGQNLATLMGSVLRIDVDRQQGGKPYAIPADNPFRSVKKARPEIFAYGFRNIWRLSVDRKTGHIWAGDVGQDLWEEVNIVERGGNYGWSVREGSYPFGNAKQKSSTKPIDPVWEYDHQVGKSITGGFVCRGRRLPELVGCYLYADYVSGKIWALRYDAASKRVVSNYRLAKGGIPVLAFGEDEDGEVYYLVGSVKGDGIYRFERKAK